MKIKNYTTSEKLVDRDDDIEQIEKLLNEAKKSQVHIVFAKTGYGKSSFTIKLAQKIMFSNWDIVRVITIPKNIDTNVPEGDYLDLIFNALMKHFKTEGHAELFFDNYLANGENKLLENLALNEAIDSIASAGSIKKSLSRLIGMSSKRSLRIGAFDPYKIINNDSPFSRSIKADYIRYLFEQTRILLIIENIQNIDNLSLKYLVDWINDTKNNKHGFLLEFTISEVHTITKMNSLQKSFSQTGVDVYECELEKMPLEYIADIIESQIENHSTDIHFTIEAQQHYNDYSNGNLWDLIDFARMYEGTEESAEIPTPTLSILRSLSFEAQCIVSIVVFHNGIIAKSLLDYIWLNNFSNKPQSVLEAIYHELINTGTIRISKDKIYDQITISHASILDVWQSDVSHFIAIDRETYKRLNSFYIDNYNGVIHNVEKQFAWQMLIRLYAINEPSKIMELLNDFKQNLLNSISRENTWNYLNLLIQHTQNYIVELENIYFQILQICRSAALYEEGYYCIELMEHYIDIEKNHYLLLNKLLFLSILDNHLLVIELYKKSLIKTEIYSPTWIKLNLLVLNSYIVLGNKTACKNIDASLKQMKKFTYQKEYPIYLRLTNIYMEPSKALINAKKSINIFHKQGDSRQEGKSLITYSKLLSSLGKHKKAIKMIKRAETLLVNSNEGLSCIYNNLAGYELLCGNHGSEVWDYLDVAEIHSVSTYDKLSVVLNKLAWCYENNSFVRLDLLENKALELIELEPSQFIHCTTFYNMYIVMKKAGMEEKANKYYFRAVELKDKCSCIKARIDGITQKNRHLKPRIKKPYHICYLSFWLFDL